MQPENGAQRQTLLPDGNAERFSHEPAVSNEGTCGCPSEARDALRRLTLQGNGLQSPQGPTGAAIGNFAKSFFTAFPDMSLEVISIGDIGGGSSPPVGAARHQHRQIRRCTPATGRRVTLPGASFIQVEGDKIRSERVYHDRQIVDEQLIERPIRLGLT